MNNRTILLVEDNHDDVVLTVRALQKNNLGNDVYVVWDGLEALDFLYGRNAYAERNPQELPQLILLDLDLPKMNGLELLRRLREDERTRLLPVVVLSTSDEEQDVVLSYTCGANSYIQKSLDYKKFVETIRQLGIYWLKLNDFPAN